MLEARHKTGIKTDNLIILLVILVLKVFFFFTFCLKKRKKTTTTQDDRFHVRNWVFLQTLYKSHSQLLAWSLPENSPSLFWLSLQNQAGSCPLECPVFQGIEVVQAPQDNAPGENLRVRGTKTKSVSKTQNTTHMQVTIQNNLSAVVEFPCCYRYPEGTHRAFLHPTYQFPTGTYIFLENKNVK